MTHPKFHVLPQQTRAREWRGREIFYWRGAREPTAPILPNYLRLPPAIFRWQFGNFHIESATQAGEGTDTELLNEGRDGDDIDDEHDTHSITLDSLLIRADKGYQFEYIYDFGDYRQHLVTFEGMVGAKPKTKYPVCVEGARACPPEDVGSTPGYQEFLEALADPHHEQHEHLKERSGGSFDPENFSAREATLSMQKGVIDWRDYHV